jgi:hypothetical protein
MSRVAPKLQPTRAQALVASGLLDIAVGIEDLSGALADAVAYELNGFCSHWQVRAAIRRGIGDLLNSHEFSADASTDEAKSARQIILDTALERSRGEGDPR